MKLSVKCASILLVPFLQIPAWSSASGTSGASILNIPLGARAISMGEAYTALADDASSLYWNPAGIAILNQSEASFAYNHFINDLTYQNASVAMPLENGGLGASVSYLSYGNIDGFEADGTPAGSVNAYSAVGTLGAGWLGNYWSAGVNVKGIQESLADVKANGFATDLGATVVYPHEVKGGTLRLATTVRNIGPGIKFIDQSDPLPQQWRVGLAAVQMLNKKLNLSMDYGKERDASGAVYFGTEYWLISHLALRAGYAGTDSEGSGIRAGVGLKFKDISFNYAYSGYGDLGFSHVYELSMRFGTVHPRLSPEERELFKRAKLALAQYRYGEATELFDALLQMEPDYRPAQRLVKISMAGYDKAEKDNAMAMTPGNLNNGKRFSVDSDELKDLEQLLKLSDEGKAQNAQLVQPGKP
jgi:hypothetical protein